MLAQIRDATASDAPALANVHVLSWKFAHRGLFPDEVVEGLSFEERERSWRETLANPSPGKMVLVADRAGEVLGFTSFGPTRDPFSQPGIGEVYEFFVHPDAIGTGVGDALFQDTLARFKDEGFRTVTLWVVEGNERAQRSTAGSGCAPTAPGRSRVWAIRRLSRPGTG